METITGKRNMIGDEYVAMCNTFDKEEIKEHATAIKMLCQRLIELCDMTQEEYKSISLPLEA